MRAPVITTEMLGLGLGVNPLEYVDRGDVAAYDFILGGLTMDGNYHALDLSAILPDSARIVEIYYNFKRNAVDGTLRFRNIDVTTEFSMAKNTMLVTGRSMYGNFAMRVDDTKIIYYNGTNDGNWVDCNITVTGWWLQRPPN